jgi:hypothetical protein
MHRSTTHPEIELTLPQTVGAQLGEQPTPESMERARMQAHSIFAEILSRAKALDQTGNRAACMQAVRDARNMIRFE